MDLYSFALFMTDDCNFDCHYCYQKKGNTTIDTGTIRKAIDFFFPFLQQDCYFNFYGGEPLLAWDKIIFALDYLQFLNRRKVKNIIFSMTTNGSMLSNDILNVIDLNKFLLLISYDGTVQDVSRKKGSCGTLVEILKKTLQYPRIDLETNSVFTPSTIANLSDSIISIVEMGVPNVSFAPSQTEVWDLSSVALYEKELESLAQYIISSFGKSEQIPVVNFRKKYTRGVFTCTASVDRMALTADEKLWGCHLFADVYKDKEESEEYAKYCFGDLDTFMKDREKVSSKISPHYRNLRVDRFYSDETRCADCPDLKDCSVCPMENMLQNQSIEKVSYGACRLKKITRRIRNKIWKEYD